jgi:hypothetical protein
LGSGFFYIPGTDKAIRIGGYVRQPIVSLELGAAKVTLPNRSFLGSENGGNLRLGLFTPDRSASGESVSGSLKFDTSGYWTPRLNGYSGSSWAKIGFYHAKFDASQSIGTISPGNGNWLLLPGSGGGWVLSVFPQNIVQDARYSTDLSKTGGRFDWGQTWHVPSGLFVEPYVSAGYGRTSFNEQFSGSVPGYLRNFTYSSDARVDQFKLRFGLGLSKDWLMPGGLTFSLGGTGELGPDFSKASGRDNLSFTGLPDLGANPSASRTALGYKLGLSAGLKTQSGWNVTLAGSYMSETGLPVFERDGNNSTQMKLESGDAWTVRLGARIEF